MRCKCVQLRIERNGKLKLMRLKTACFQLFYREIGARSCVLTHAICDVRLAMHSGPLMRKIIFLLFFLHFLSSSDVSQIARDLREKNIQPLFIGTARFVGEDTVCHEVEFDLHERGPVTEFQEILENKKVAVMEHYCDGADASAPHSRSHTALELTNSNM
ncbi:hypothetical protein L596_016224 [Steinernema carpocapsae]|uniref:Uncharacterized protein n=1 Tax=Steinernema carpocapsae TaxID=34508 RepID=A0A4U5NI47_STECR|nr:hypothetical protein L596_016224 [Steinernema carpocapsae]